MDREKIFPNPFDSAHTVMFSLFPIEYTETIGVPGIFVKKINRLVNLKDGTGGEMDSAFILDPDGEILQERVAACLEHQSTPVQLPKLNKFGDYDIQLVFDENLPTLLIVASHLNPEKSKNTLIRSPSDITKLYFLGLGEENICKRLNTVEEIIENNQHLDTKSALNLGVIALYAPRKHAREITEKVAKIYTKIIDDLDFKMQNCLYLVIYMMIDAYFDDKKDYWRLINMIDGKTSQEIEDVVAPIKEYFRESEEGRKKSLARANEKISKLEAENSRIPELEAENSRIPELEAEIARLNEKLNGK